MKTQYKLYEILGRHFSAIWKSGPGELFLTGGLSFLTAIGNVGVTIATQLFFDQAIYVAEKGWIGGNILFWLLLVLFVRVLVTFTEVTFNVYGRNMLKNLERLFDCKMHEKLAMFDPIEFEKPEVLDRISRARYGIRGSTSLIFVAVLTCAHYFPYFCIMGIYLARMDPLLLLVIPLCVLPALLAFYQRVAAYKQTETQVTPYRRKYEYYETTIIDRTYFKETRAHGIYAFMRKKYQKAIHDFRRIYISCEKKTLRAVFSVKGVEIFAYVAVIVLLIRALAKGCITPGAFAAVFGSVHVILQTAAELFRDHFGGMAVRYSAICGYFELMDTPERTGKKHLMKANAGIVLKNVSFKYPEQKEFGLQDISLSIRSGETIALVGTNGAGKSTLVKLILGLYLPGSGTVEMFGQDTADTVFEELFQDTSAVFQDYQRYPMTLSENIFISNTAEPEDMHKTKRSLEFADVPLNSENFPDGLDTMLSREFGGVDLSGGQWQRVAIARGIYRPHRLIVLDEPTAAIDPIEEKLLYEKFMQMAKSTTAVLVTHRLGSARMADRIVVMDNGRIVEEGTHDALLKQNGKYAAMYASQAQWYR